MKYSSDSALFCEQVQQLQSMYENWNDCERTVVMYALFKRLPFANLKFLMHSIDSHLKQSFSTPHHVYNFEEMANATSFLNKLVLKYSTLVTLGNSNDKLDAVSETDSGCDSDRKNPEEDLVSKYTSKEDVVSDLLTFLPLLRPNNEDGKKVYMQLVALLIEDSTKHNLPIELVQQVLSYLLIHPAIKSDDRK